MQVVGGPVQAIFIQLFIKFSLPLLYKKNIWLDLFIKHFFYYKFFTKYIDGQMLIVFRCLLISTRFRI